MILSSDYKQQILAVINAVNEGEITENDINNAVSRILRWKISLGLI